MDKYWLRDRIKEKTHGHSSSFPQRPEVFTGDTAIALNGRAGMQFHASSQKHASGTTQGNDVIGEDQTHRFGLYNLPMK